MEHAFTAEEVKKISPHYRGDLKNFDPTKVKSKAGKRTIREITGKAPPPAQTKKSQLPAELPPPRKLEAANTPTPQRNHDILSEAIYAPKVTIAELQPLEMFEANFSMLPNISNVIYRELEKDASQLDRAFTKEELNYYTTALLWLRLLDIKKKNGRQNLTQAEKDLLRTTENDTYTVPAPVYAYLQSVGNVKDTMGKTTYLKVPDLPTAVAEGLGGYHSVEVTTTTHNLYEEVPCLGVAGDMVMLLSSQYTEPARNFKIKFPVGTEASQNLLGNQVAIGDRRPEIKRKLAGYEITQTAFPDDGNGTRFNRPYVLAMSDALKKCNTFKNEEVTFSKLTTNGNMTMVITTEPEAVGPTERWTNVTAYSTSPEESSAATLGAASIFGFQLKKKAKTEEATFEANKNWLCVRKTGQGDWPGMRDWFDNKNARRQLPPVLQTARFYSLGLNLEEQRIDIIRRQVVQPR